MFDMFAIAFALIVSVLLLVICSGLVFPLFLVLIVFGHAHEHDKCVTYYVLFSILLSGLKRLTCVFISCECARPCF